jgi:hypothetical protein
MKKTLIKKDYYKIIEDNVEIIFNKKKKPFYLSNTLCINDIHKNIVFTINLDGKYNVNSIIDTNTKTDSGLLSSELREKVFQIFLRTKGENEYYNKELDKFKKESRKEKIEKLNLD